MLYVKSHFYVIIFCPKHDRPLAPLIFYFKCHFKIILLKKVKCHNNKKKGRFKEIIRNIISISRGCYAFLRSVSGPKKFIVTQKILSLGKNDTKHAEFFCSLCH